MKPSGTNHGIRFSLRTLLATIAFFAVACAALKFANNIWWVALSSVALVLFMAMAVVALVGDGRQRAFAIGFVICGFLYGVIVYSFGASELNPDLGTLPTTQLTRPVLRALNHAPASKTWDVPVSGGLRPATGPGSGTGTGGGRGNGQGGGGGGNRAVRANAKNTRLFAVIRSPQGISYNTFVPSAFFMPVAHLLWAMLFACLGGVFAKFVYARNERQTAAG